ncbi:MAG: hypothetical protein AAB492_02375 [Patescibacteria group bacterium]
MYILLLVFELIVLWFITRRLTQNLYVALFLLIRSRPIAIAIISFFFFPGTIIHELSHLFTAEILGVHTSGLTLTPEGLEESNVRTGSVLIAKTDPIRRAVIGVAPVFVGLGALFTISYLLPQFAFSYWVLGIGYWVLFAVSNTMFSSPEDMEGFPAVAITLSLIAIAAYFSGISVGLPASWIENITSTLSTLTTSIGYIVGLNLAVFALSFSAITIAEKLSGRKLVGR